MGSSSKKQKKILLALAVIAWLLLLGFTSYCLCLPDLEVISQSLRAIREDPNLTPEEKFEKSREIFSKLTPAQGRQVFQNDFKKWQHEKNREMQKFLKMSPEEQVAYLKKQDEERKKLGPQGGMAIKAGKGGGGNVFKAAGGGTGGGGFVFYGPPGGKPSNPSQMQKTMLDDSSPETRAGMSYQKGLPR